MNAHDMREAAARTVESDPCGVGDFVSEGIAAAIRAIEIAPAPDSKVVKAAAEFGYTPDDVAHYAAPDSKVEAVARVARALREATWDWDQPLPVEYLAEIAVAALRGEK